MCATLAWFKQTSLASDVTYSITTRCPICGRSGIKLVRICPESGSFFTNVGDYYRFSNHLNGRGELCDNSGHNPELGGPTRPQNWRHVS
jgi:hypothetical protein